MKLHKEIEVVPVRDEDINLLEALKKDKVLMPINADYFDAQYGGTLVCCLDPDHFKDTEGHIADMLKKANKPNRIAPITRAGGAIWLPKSTLIDKVGMPRDEDLLYDIDIALEHRLMYTIFLSVHAPCGAAALNDLSLFDQIELLVKGKERLKEKYAHVEGLQIKAFIVICYPGLRRRMYFVSASNWNENTTKYEQYDYTSDHLFTTASA